jgi:hypothetical protein
MKTVGFSLKIIGFQDFIKINAPSLLERINPTRPAPRIKSARDWGVERSVCKRDEMER